MRQSNTVTHPRSEYRRPPRAASEAAPGPPAARGYDTFRGITRFPALDGLRALAVVGVLWHHTGTAVRTGLEGRGEYGVDLFFAISGILITTLLLRERDGTGRVSLRNFYIRRSLRIFPLYYLVLAAYVVLTLAVQRHTPQGQAFFENLPAFLTYTSNWFVDLEAGESVTFYFAWSLATEEQFYLMWPPTLVLLYAYSRRRTDWGAGLAVVVLIGISVVATAYRQAGVDALPVRMLASLSVPILAGAGLALILHRPRGFQLLAPLLARRASAFFWSLVSLAAVVVGLDRQFIGALFAVTVAAYCVRPTGVGYRVLTWRPLVVMGTVSYGMYLMHMLVANVIRKVIGQEFSPLLFVLTVLAATAVAWVVYRYVESPILRLKDRFGASTGIPASAWGGPETRASRQARLRSSGSSRLSRSSRSRSSRSSRPARRHTHGTADVGAGHG